MKTLAILLGPERHYEPNGDFVAAGSFALLVALALWLFRSKKRLKEQPYAFWLFLGAGVSLVALGFICGAHVESEGIIEVAR